MHDNIGRRLIAKTLQVTFGVAPATVAFSLGFRTVVDQLLLTFYVLCGLTRLARFNVTVAMLPKDKTGKSKYFEGIPVPFACFTSCAVIATWSYMGLIHDSIPFGTYLTGSFLEYHPSVLMFVVLGSMMVSKTIQIPKP
jgi:CDP-diacylglycerol---serine O-phosphatidyltransferase